MPRNILAAQTMSDHLAPLGNAGKGGRLGGAHGRGSHGQHQHPLCRETGGAQAIRPLGADTQGRGGMPGLPGLIRPASRPLHRTWKSSPGRSDRGRTRAGSAVEDAVQGGDGTD